MLRLLIVVVVGLAVVTGWSSMVVIDETEMAIITQFGKYQTKYEKPGLHWKVPFIQEVRRMEKRILGSDTHPDEYLTLDKKRLVADPITRWRIVDPLQFYKSLNNATAARRRIDDIVQSELRREVASHKFGDIIGNARDPLMQAVAKRARMVSKGFGIEIVDVRIKRADLPQEVEESVYQRMQAEREREAKRYRAEGDEEAAKIKAEADKDAAVIKAEAYEKAQMARAKGDAESTAIYAKAYGKNREFYEFQRSLEVYERTIDKDATLVLSTGSELFRYLQAPGSGKR